MRKMKPVPKELIERARLPKSVPAQELGLERLPDEQGKIIALAKALVPHARREIDFFTRRSKFDANMLAACEAIVSSLEELVDAD